VLKLYFATQETRILSKGYTFSFQGKKYAFVDPSCPAQPGDALTVAHSKYCPLQVIYKDDTYKVVEFTRVEPNPAAAKLSPEELAKKRSEYGRMGRQASPFRKPVSLSSEVS
jgi:hypothetical protein